MITVGLVYTPEEQKKIEEERPINLDLCKHYIELCFDPEEKDLYPRVKDGIKYADFGVLTHISADWQTEIVSMNFPTVDFNQFSSPHTDQVRSINVRHQCKNYIYLLFSEFTVCRGVGISCF